MRIIDPTRIPTSIGLLFEIAKNRQAADRSFALGFIWIVTVEKRLPFIVERFFEPNQLAAQFVSARFNVNRTVPRVVIPNAKLFASRSGAQGRCENRSCEKRKCERRSMLKGHECSFLRRMTKDRRCAAAFMVLCLENGESLEFTQNPNRYRAPAEAYRGVYGHRCACRCPMRHFTG